MNKLSLFIVIGLSVALLNSCNDKSAAPKDKTAKAQVSVTKIQLGTLPDYLKLTGKTIYLNKNTIAAPINGYITKVNVREGSRVAKGSVIFEIQSQEAYALQKNDSLKKNYGKIKIYAPTSGIISGLNVMQKEVYTDQGSDLCKIIASGNLKVQVDVPFEYRKYAKIGQKCIIELPDSTFANAVFSKILPQMNNQNQTMKVLANLNTGIFVPEDMLVKIKIDIGTKKETQILDRKCLMTDALMTEFWLMKVINDSTAVKVPVKIGNQTHKLVEIVSPEFDTKDRFINEGAYGLSDTALIKIIIK